jgi:erythromycin esterase
MNEARDWLGRNMLRIRTLDPADEDFSDLEGLRGIIGEARIVGLGESMHRVHEFSSLRHRLFQFLVAELGFTAIAVESGFAEGLSVQQWLDTGEGDVGEAASAGFTYHFGKCAEATHLLEWMRRGSRDGGGPRFYGVDVGSSSGGILSTVEAAVGILDLADAAYAARLRRVLLPLLDYLPADDGGIAWAAEAIGRYLALDPEHRRSITAEVAALTIHVEALWPEYARRIGSGEAWNLRRLADTALLGNGFLAAMVTRSEGGIAASSARDAAMARNVGAILEREERVLVCAANGHLQRSPMLAPPVLPEPIPTLGEMLAATYGDDYVPIATTFGSGTVWLHRPKAGGRPGHSVPYLDHLDDAAPQSLDRMLAEPAIPIGLLNLRDLPAGSPIDGRLAEVRSTMNGDGEMLADPRVAFDAAIHIDQITPWRTWLADDG